MKLKNLYTLKLSAVAARHDSNKKPETLNVEPET